MFIINGYTANVKKKKRKENNSNISKMFRLPARVKLDRFNYNLSIVFDYTPLREKDTNKPFLNFYFPFLSLIFNFSSPPLELSPIPKKKSALHEKYTRRYNKTRGRFSFESREKYSHSRCPNKIVLETIAVAEAKP